jgi:hypothetical protein
MAELYPSHGSNQPHLRSGPPARETVTLLSHHTAGRWAAPEGHRRARAVAGGCGAWLLYRRIQTGVTMERHVLESLLTSDDEASVRALATLRSGAPTGSETGHNPQASMLESSGVDFSACGCTDSNLLGWNEQCSSSVNMASPCAQG